MSDVQVSYYSLRSLENSVTELVSRTASIAGKVSTVQNDLARLRREFIDMMKRQDMQFAFQRAVSEVIRVRQELEQKFGNHAQVRQHMLGILDATDLALIRQTTMASCSEELMLATPKYWLSPCLIALSAWISNNKSLAERAIKEAVKRDDEKTSLVFALICRRNGRTDTCFEWLSRYFAQQNATDMKESIIAYIDAYANGIFGEDKDNLCTEYINYWMGQLQETNPNFKSEQHEYWKRYFLSYCMSVAPKFKMLASVCPEFELINTYLSRVEATASISKSFNDTLGAPVNKGDLVGRIDLELKHLITEYEEAEKSLRDEEEYYSLVKDLKGDEGRAERIVKLRASMRTDKPVNLAERLSDAIVKKSTTAVSAQKTAIRFLSEYIQDSYTEFVDEKQDEFPKEITLNLMEWQGKTTDGSNESDLKASLQTHLQTQRTAALKTVKPTAMIVGGVISLLALVALIVGFVMDGFIWLGIVGVVLFICGLIFVLAALLKFKHKKKQINALFDTRAKSGPEILGNAINEWKAAQAQVAEFIAGEGYNKLSLTEVDG